MAVERYELRTARARSRLGTVYAAAAVTLLAAAVGGLAWSRPTKVASVLRYTQTGQLSYSAPAKPGSVYGTQGLMTGQPIYADAVNAVNFTYSYRFETAHPTELSGTAQLSATINDGQGISRTFPLEAPTGFTGGAFVAEGRLALSQLLAAATSFDRAAGSSAPASYTVSITPSVDVHGRVGTVPVSATLGDPVTFSYDRNSLVPDSSAPSAAPGPSPAAKPSQQQQQLGSSQAGSVTEPDAGTATLVRGVPVLAARIGSLALLILAVVVGALAGRRWLADATSDDEGARIIARHGTSLVEATQLPDGPHIATVHLDSFDGLMQVARRLECPLLHQGGEHDVYAVVDNSCLYRYAIPARKGAGPVTTAPRIASEATGPRYGAVNGYTRNG